MIKCNSCCDKMVDSGDYCIICMEDTLCEDCIKNHVCDYNENGEMGSLNMREKIAGKEE